MPGLNPDFSDPEMRSRIEAAISGLPPHERPGHVAPPPLPENAVSAIAAIDALRHPPQGEEFL
jgi:hypothetical protein